MPEGFRPERRQLGLWVPKSTRESGIRSKSGVVGFSLRDPAHVTVYYEGCVHGPVANIVTYADRVRHAAGRMVTAYPTLACARLSREQLFFIGWYGGADFTIEDPIVLQLWLDTRALAPELAFTDRWGPPATAWWETLPFWEKE